MNKLVSGGLWGELKRLAKRSRVRMAAVAYVTSENVKFGTGDLLIVDASKQAIESGQTSAPLLRRAFGRGAELYSCPGLHAKVMLLDEVAVIGSANISQSSEQTLIEAALLTDNLGTVSMARAFLEMLKANSTLIDEAFIERIKSIEVKRMHVWGFHPKKRRGFSVKPGQHQTWLITVYPLDEERYPSETTYVERGTKEAEELLSNARNEVRWIRLAGTKSLFQREARAGDSVIQIWVNSKKSKRPNSVAPSSTILLRQEEPRCTRFFLEQPAYLKKGELTWGQFQKLARQVGLPYKVGRYTTRLLPEEYADALASLWREIKKRK